MQKPLGINAIKENKSWKQLPITIGPEAPSSFDLIQFEELDDYSLENIPLSERFDSSDEEHPSNKKVAAQTTHKKVKETTTQKTETKETTEVAEDGKKKKRKRRKRKKKKQQEKKVDDDKEKVEDMEENKLEEDDELDLSTSLEVDVSLGEAAKEAHSSSTQEAEAYDPNILSEYATIVKSGKRKMKRKTEKVEENSAKKPKVDENDTEKAKVEENEGEKPKADENEGEKPMADENEGEKAKDDEIIAEKPKEENEEVEVSENDIIAQIPDWNHLALPLPILRALCDEGFKTPMPIQEQVIPVAIHQRKDVLGAAETGSGKTLAFGIPLICHLLEDKARSFIPDPSQETEEEKEEEFPTEDLDEDFDDDELMMSITNKKKGHGLAALILTPTRELAIQVKNHLVKMTKYTDLRLVAVVGGMNEERQTRLLNKKPDIVIATPGRLNKLVHTGDIDHISRLQTLRYLVIDEADRMLERGHFTDLQKLLEIINSPDCYPKRQNFLFSATLTTVNDVSVRVKKQTGYKAETKDKKLEQLAKQLVGKRKPHVVDLTTAKMTAEKLKEARILCPNDEKDFYLYYFIKAHPGRTLIFVNSIDCIFRLNGVFEALNCEPLHLHAKMQQRQRLKHLDRFQEDDNAIMVASDVAARGLDIPDVKYVIHYQVPRTLEVFIHRSGRSARSGKDGLSLLFVSPQESNNYKKICRSTNKPEGLPVFPINNDVMTQVKIRVKMARELDLLVHKAKKIRVENDWFNKMAEQADMIVDDDLIIEDKGSKEKQHLIKMKRQQLSRLLKKPIFPRGFSGNFITKTGSIQRPDYQFAHK